MMNASDGAAPARRWAPLAIFVAVLAATTLLPESILHVFDYAGMAVCHRIPARTYFIAGEQLPVCARDTGMFSAALLVVITLLSRPGNRAAGFPPRSIIAALAVLVLAWAFDGFNSYLLLLRNEVFLYAPRNELRLLTGAGMGLAIGVFASALFNQVAWRDAYETPVIETWRALLSPCLAGIAVVVMVLWRPPFAYGPLASLSGLGVAALLTLVNTMLVLLLTRRYSTFAHWRALAPFALAGCALAIAEIALIAILRITFLPELRLPQSSP